MRTARLIGAACLATMALWAADISGKWTADVQGRNGNTMTVTMNFKADGDKLTGTVGGRMGDTEISDGKVDGDTVSFSVVREFNDRKFTQNYKGKLDGDTIHFTITMEGGPNGGGGGGGGAAERKMDAHRATT